MGSPSMDTVWRSEDITEDAARWVMSAPGREVLADLLQMATDDPLAVATRLRDAGLEADRAATAQGVATASRRAWEAGQPEGSWWTPAGAEQASHPQLSHWRARRFAGTDVVDVTAGCGGDALALAAGARQVLVSDHSAARLPLLAVNLRPRATVVQADARRPCVRPDRWWAWADPGRRVQGRRVRRLGGTQPPVPQLTALGYAGLGIAVSPAVDLADPDRPGDAEIEFVQVGHQLAEAALWLGDARDTGPGERSEASATLLPEGLHHRGTPTGPDRPVVDVGAWLAEPAPALVRARLVDEVAADLGLGRLARTRALFTGVEPVDSPWFRLEAVEAVVPPRPSKVRDALDALEERPVELLTHGMSVDARTWWRGMGSPPRGPRGRAVHLARLDRTSVAIVTRRDGTA